MLVPLLVAARARTHVRATRLRPTTAKAMLPRCVVRPRPLGRQRNSAVEVLPHRRRLLQRRRRGKARIGRTHARAAAQVHRHGRGCGVRAPAGRASPTPQASFPSAPTAAVAAAAAVSVGTHPCDGETGMDGGGATAACLDRRGHRVRPPPLPTRAVVAAVATAHRDAAARRHHASLEAGAHP